MAYSPWSVIAGETPTATKWNVLGSNDADFDDRIGQLNDDKTLGTATDQATVYFDLATHLIWTVTLGGDRTLALQNERTGVPFVIRLKQDATGNRTVTWWSGIKWPASSAPTLSTAPNAIDAFGFIKISSGVFDGFFLGFGLA